MWKYLVYLCFDFSFASASRLMFAMHPAAASCNTLSCAPTISIKGCKQQSQTININFNTNNKSTSTLIRINYVSSIVSNKTTKVKLS